MTKSKLYQIVKIILGAIASILAVLAAANCTATMSISKYNNSSPQSVQQSTSTSVDSTSINLKP